MYIYKRFKLNLSIDNYNVLDFLELLNNNIWHLTSPLIFDLLKYLSPSQVLCLREILTTSNTRDTTCFFFCVSSF